MPYPSRRPADDARQHARPFDAARLTRGAWGSQYYDGEAAVIGFPEKTIDRAMASGGQSPPGATIKTSGKLRLLH
jgi:hypothetical protein